MREETRRKRNITRWQKSHQPPYGEGLVLNLGSISTKKKAIHMVRNSNNQKKHLLVCMIYYLNSSNRAIDGVCQIDASTHNTEGSRCRAPFKPKSGQQGDDAAPRSCKPQADLKTNHLTRSHNVSQSRWDRTVGTMNEQLHHPSKGPFIGSKGAPLQIQPSRLSNWAQISKRKSFIRLCKTEEQEKIRTVREQVDSSVFFFYLRI